MRAFLRFIAVVVLTGFVLAAIVASPFLAVAVTR